jgi:3-oxoacyl-[acyl-carrier protein] reductase
MDLELSGKRALVTGSSAGIGRAIARRLAEEGVIVAVTGRDGRKAAAVANEIQAKTGRRAVSFAADLATDGGAKDLASQVAAALGGIDILVNNHGIYRERGWWDTSADDWADIYNQNVVSFVRLIREFGPRMGEAGWGRIINISSGGAWQPFANMADYTATKAAILNLTVSLAKAFAGQGVTVNTVSPGIIVTESTEAYFRKVARDRGWPDDWRDIEQRVIANFLFNSTGRLGRPADVANIVALVASPLSDYMNGANYRVDGGSTTAIN